MTAPEETPEIEYTPTTHEAQSAWINYRLDYNRFGRRNFGRGDAIGREFDRWLASVKAEAAVAERDRVAVILVDDADRWRKVADRYREDGEHTESNRYEHYAIARRGAANEIRANFPRSESKS